MKVDQLPFAEIWFHDFEYVSRPGERPDVVCLVAHEYRSRRRIVLRRDQMPAIPPYNVDASCIFINFVANAECLCHLTLGWPVPVNVLDLNPAYRRVMHGLKLNPKKGLLEALHYYGLDAMSELHKQAMRERILQGPPFTEPEWRDILRYCAEDVEALIGLLEKILAEPDFDLKVALHHSEFTSIGCAHMEYWGVPLDEVITPRLMDERIWKDIRNSMVPIVNEKYGVYVRKRNGDWSFSQEQFGAYLEREGLIEIWPRTATGKLRTDDETLEEMSDAYKQLMDLRHLFHVLEKMRTMKLAVGADMRNRTVLWPFVSKTSRTQPRASQWIFSPAVWLRFLIKPGAGMAIAYIDYSSMEFLIAAALSDRHYCDENPMLEAYLNGDAYLYFCKRLRVVPQNAIREDYEEIRDLYKQMMLLSQYGGGPETLAVRLGIPSWQAHLMLVEHREIFAQYWKWSVDWLHHSLNEGVMRTPMGWSCTVGITETNDRSIQNWPIQSAGADILRIAIVWGIKRGIKILAPVHDAVLIEAPIDRIDADVAKMQEIMRRASRIVLGGHELRSEAKIVRYPDRYTDKRGKEMWAKVTSLLEEISGRDAAPKKDAA